MSKPDEPWYALVLQYQPLLYSIAQKYARLMPVEDVASAGRIGLVQAAIRYQNNKPDCAFATIARTYIRGRIVDAVRDQNGRTGRKFQSVPFSVHEFDQENSTRSSTDIEGDYLQKHAVERLRSAIALLDCEQRALIVAIYLNGEPLARYSARVGWADSKARRTRRSALSALRRTLDAYGIHDYPDEIEGGQIRSSHHGTLAALAV